VRALARRSDLVLLDVKAEPDAYPRLTGGEYQTLEASLEVLRECRARLWLRLPLVGGVNDTDGHFRNVSRLVAAWPNAERVEVVPYHALGAEKCARFGLAPVELAAPAATEEAIAGWIARLRAFGVEARAVA
jgi:pyruvate formate lyase activating enzyme